MTWINTLEPVRPLLKLWTFASSTSPSRSPKTSYFWIARSWWWLARHSDGALALAQDRRCHHCL